MNVKNLKYLVSDILCLLSACQATDKNKVNKPQKMIVILCVMRT